MRTAANLIIEGRMRPYSRRLCTVALDGRPYIGQVDVETGFGVVSLILLVYEF